MTLTGSTVDGNEANDDGGGIRNAGGLLLLTASVVSGNTTADDGGGIRNEDGVVIVRQSVVSGNTAEGSDSNFGGGIFNVGGTTELIGSVVTGNVARIDGGGLQNDDGRVEITDTTVRENTAGDDGGGIVNKDTMVLTRTTVSGNLASGDSGGGIFNYEGTLSVTNSTVSGNEAGAKAGGIFNRQDATLDLSNSTLSDNTAGGAGGGIHNQGTASFQNTIIAGNVGSSAVDCSDTSALSSLGHNLVGFGTGCPGGGAGDQQIDPALVFTTILGPLQNNAGPTQTHALLPESPALDAGDPAGCTDALGSLLTRDQRVLPRTQDGLHDGTAVCDVGAYERQPAEAIRTLVLLLDNEDLKSAGGGHRDAMLDNLASIDQRFASGNDRRAQRKLLRLRRHVDGCGATADRNDWVVNCDKQTAIRAAIDDLL
jgi:hypothetical protein